MARLQNSDEICSSIYVDFDTIYARILEQDENLARTFATNPQRWLRWIEGHALRMLYGDGIRRRILKRHCYMCSEHYQEFRPFFLRSAFHVTECPRLGSSGPGPGKTNANIQLTIDCLDALHHATHFDEFIILSADTDFTPLLLRIQECARRSLVLSAGQTSPAHASACSWRIREDWFAAQALEEPRLDDQDAREEQRLPQPPQREARTAAGNAKTDDEAEPAPSRGPSLNLPGHKRSRLVEIIKQLTMESGVPVPLPSVSQVIQREMESSPDWFGAGTLRELLQCLDLEPLEISRVKQGYVFDPTRHERPVDSGTLGTMPQSDPELYKFAVKVHRLTDMPLLRPDYYGQLFSFIADELQNKRISRAKALRSIEDRCEEESLPIDQSQIAFVVNAAWPAEAKFKEGDSPDRERVRQTYYQRALELCGTARMPFGQPEQQLMNRWLGGPGKQPRRAE